jgi:hypothetical protein
LNPIEEAFAQLKQWTKKHHQLASTFTLFEDFLRLGMDEVQKVAKGHFTKCRLGRTLPRDDEDMTGDIAEDLDENEYY